MKMGEGGKQQIRKQDKVQGSVEMVGKVVGKITGREGQEERASLGDTDLRIKSVLNRREFGRGGIYDSQILETGAKESP